MTPPCVTRISRSKHQTIFCVSLCLYTQNNKRKKKKVHVPVPVCICVGVDRGLYCGVSVDRGLYCGVGVDRGLYCEVCVRDERWMCDKECVDYCVILSAPPPPLCVM